MLEKPLLMPDKISEKNGLPKLGTQTNIALAFCLRKLCAVLLIL